MSGKCALTLLMLAVSTVAVTGQDLGSIRTKIAVNEQDTKITSFMNCEGQAIDLNQFKCCRTRYSVLTQEQDQQIQQIDRINGATEKKYDPKREGCCNGRVYDLNHQRCCDDTVIYEFGTHGCCNRVKYHLIQQSCCNGIVYHKKSHDCCATIAAYAINDGGCCNGEIINPLLAHCCKGEVIPLAQRCLCGQQEYNANTHDCCGDKVYRIGLAFCCNGVLGKQPCTCGDIVYDHRRFVCCDGRFIKPIAEGCSKCGETGAVYNDATEKCCGDKPYNPYTQYCCDGVVQSTPCRCGRATYDPTTHVCCQPGDQIRSIKVGCTEKCGYRTYDSATHKCCDDTTIVPIQQHCPCDGRDYNPRTHKCCEGGYIVNIYQQCQALCGNQWYIVGHRLKCCWGVLIPIAEKCPDCYSPQTSCMCGRLPFSPKTHKCCQPGDIITLNSLPCDFCTRVKFDPRIYRCCDGVVQPIADPCGCLECRCGKVAYNPATQHCCPNYVIKPLSESCDACGSVKFDPRTHHCCNGVVLPIHVHCVPCGGIYYNYATEKCCPGDIITPSQISCDVCDGQVYDLTLEKCCPGGIIICISQPCPDQTDVYPREIGYPTYVYGGGRIPDTVGTGVTYVSTGSVLNENYSVSRDGNVIIAKDQAGIVVTAGGDATKG